MLNDLMLDCNTSYRRINSDARNDWFRLKLTSTILEDGDHDYSRNLYDEFGRWFERECKGNWAYPTPYLLLFTNEEDKCKFILKYM